MTPLDALRRHFGHTAFRSGQEAVMAALLAGRSALALFPTGAGKSLCYQIPALLREGTALVVSPLLALMKDQVETLRARGIAAARLDSTLNAAEQAALWQEAMAGKLRLLYVAPERFADDAFVQRLGRLRISLLAIDEAHCISEWGHNFRPDYLRLAGMARQLGLSPVLCLTATATPAAADDICRAFGIEPRDRVQTPFRRPNLSYHVEPVPARERLPRLVKALRRAGRLPAVVYVTLQEEAERVATALAREGFRARAYHAGLPADQRAEAQDAFMSGATDVMAATIAFGMGIDKSNIRSVIHFNLPKSLENYLQETGRAGRDGKPAHCLLLACADDLTVLRNFVCGDTPGPRAVAAVIDALLRQGETFDISHYDLAAAADIRPHVLETVLAYLELEGLVHPLGSHWSTCRLELLTPPHRLLPTYAPDERALIAALLDLATPGRRWLTLDLATAATATGATPTAIRSVLGTLEQNGDAVLAFRLRRHRYRLGPQAATAAPGEVAARMADLFAAREARDLSRLDDVVAFAAHPGCLTSHLLERFGERLAEPCGSCGNCRRPPDGPRPLPATPAPRITTADAARMQALIAERHAALRSARQLARFLCGLSGPAVQRARLSGHEAFGSLAAVPFPDVLDHARSLLPE